jgi:hypothetical protein
VAGCGPTNDRPAELIADTGYHSRTVLKDLASGPWQTRIVDPSPSRSSAGGAISTPGGRSMAVGRACDRQSARRPSHYGREGRRLTLSGTELILRWVS